MACRARGDRAARGARGAGGLSGSYKVTVKVTRFEWEARVSTHARFDGSSRAQESVVSIGAQTKPHINPNVAIHTRSYAANTKRTTNKRITEQLEPQLRKAYKENTVFTIIATAISCNFPPA